ncbi:MAG TPA: OmpA family protein [Halomonas sp.]|nr:OmpA family protein [Halomonas sp.]
MIDKRRETGRHDALLELLPPEDEGGSWMISYVDVMTLLVVLLVLIIALDRIGGGPALGDSGAAAEGARPLASARGSAPLGVPLPEPLGNLLAELSRVPLVVPAKPAEYESVAKGLLPRAVSAALGVAGLPLAVPASAGEEVSSKAIAAASAVAEAWREAPYIPDLEGVEVSRIPEGVRLRVEDHLLFPTAEAQLTDAGLALVAGRLRELVERHPGEVAVEGHSDSRSISTERFPSNWALSSARAIAIVEALVSAGVAPDRLRAVGLADTRPLADNRSAEGRARNRRVEVTIQALR